MPLRYLRTFDLGSISAGGSSEGTWTPAEDVHIRRIYFVDRSAEALNNVDVYLKIGSQVITRDSAPASIFGQDPLTALEVDLDVAKGTEIYWKVVNNDSTAHSIVLVFEVVSG